MRRWGDVPCTINWTKSSKVLDPVHEVVSAIELSAWACQSSERSLTCRRRWRTGKERWLGEGNIPGICLSWSSSADILGNDFACMDARYSAILCGGWAAIEDVERSFVASVSEASLRFYVLY